jgi:hypothetical protein
VQARKLGNDDLFEFVTAADYEVHSYRAGDVASGKRVLFEYGAGRGVVENALYDSDFDERRPGTGERAHGEAHIINLFSDKIGHLIENGTTTYDDLYATTAAHEGSGSGYVIDDVSSLSGVVGGAKLHKGKEAAFLQFDKRLGKFHSDHVGDCGLSVAFEGVQKGRDARNREKNDHEQNRIRHGFHISRLGCVVHAG